jgi:hypothetical protein
MIGNRLCRLFAKLLGPSFYGMSHWAELIQLTECLSVTRIRPKMANSSQGKKIERKRDHTREGEKLELAVILPLLVHVHSIVYIYES